MKNSNEEYKTFIVGKLPQLQSVVPEGRFKKAKEVKKR